MFSRERALPHRLQLRPRVGWTRQVAAHFALARVSNSPTVVSDALAGAALAGSLGDRAAVALVALALVLFYTAGMFLNDYFDYAADCRDRPSRPLPSGAVPRASAALGAAALLAVASAILWSLRPASFWCGLALAALIVLYDRWHKENPLSPLLMGLCRLGAYLVAFLAFSSEPSAPLMAAGLLLFLYTAALTFVAKSETHGSLTRYWPVAILLLPCTYFAFEVPAVAGPLLVLFVAWVVYSVSFAYRSRSRDVGGAVARLIAGIAILDSLVLAARGAPVGVVLALAAFLATRFLQRYVPGT